MLILYFLGAVILSGIDQLSKLFVLRYIKPEDTIPLLKGIFHLTYCENRGAAFGILQGRFGLLFITTLLVIIAATVYMIKKRPQSLTLTTSVTLLIGGAIGNLIDRLFRNEVVDFLGFDFGSYAFPRFNVADICITCGCILLVIIVLFSLAMAAIQTL